MAEKKIVIYVGIFCREIPTAPTLKSTGDPEADMAILIAERNDPQ